MMDTSSGFESYNPLDVDSFEHTDADFSQNETPYGLNTTSFVDDGEEELDPVEIEAMLYSQIYFENNLVESSAEPNTPSRSVSVTEIHVEEHGSHVPAKLQHTSSMSAMLNYSARSFMSPECKEVLKVKTEQETTTEINSKDQVTAPKVVTLSSSIDTEELDEEVVIAARATKSKMLKMLDKSESKKRKRKHENEIVVLSDSDFEVEKSRKRKKKKHKEIEEVSPVKKKKPKNVISVASSDSEDSLIVLGDSGVFTDAHDIQTNAAGMAPEDRNNATLKPVDIINIDLEKWEGQPRLSVSQVLNLLKPGDWHICDDDLYGLQDSRYYTKERKIQCRNCNERGHIERNCPKEKKAPVCILCGERGHIHFGCPNKLCYNCDLPGHRSQECDQQKKSYRCTCRRCGSVGHMQHECSEIWRQFHLTLTIEGSNLVGNEPEENRNPYCYNCGEQGHFGYTCEEEGVTQYWRPVAPFVSYYEFPSYDSRERHRSRDADRCSTRRGRERESNSFLNDHSFHNKPKSEWTRKEKREAKYNKWKKNEQSYLNKPKREWTKQERKDAKKAKKAFKASQKQNSPNPSTNAKHKNKKGSKDSTLDSNSSYKDTKKASKKKKKNRQNKMDKFESAQTRAGPSIFDSATSSANTKPRERIKKFRGSKSIPPKTIFDSEVVDFPRDRERDDPIYLKRQRRKQERQRKKEKEKIKKHQEWANKRGFKFDGRSWINA